MSWAPSPDSPPAPNTGPGGVSFEYHDFTNLLNYDTRALIEELVVVHTDLANLCEHIGFLKANEPSRTPNPERVMSEGSRDALAEKKWLILKLLEGLHR